MENLTNMTNEELALLYADGNNRAFDLLLSRIEMKLFTYIKFVVHSDDLANDIFQETLVKAIIKLQKHEYSADGSFSSWCIRIAHNIMIDYYRDMKNKNLLIPDENCLALCSHYSNMDDSLKSNCIEQEMVHGQVLEDVKKMVNLLPPIQREIVYMRYYQQLPFKEISEIMGVGINTCLGRMRYALLNLRRMAKKYEICLDMD